jgi:hypothetical protein
MASTGVPKDAQGQQHDNYCFFHLNNGSLMTPLVFSTSKGYDGRVVEAEMDLLLFCSVHCLPERSKVLEAKAAYGKKASSSTVLLMARSMTAIGSTRLLVS